MPEFSSYEEYIRYLREEMRRCNHESEKARDKYYATRDKLAREKGVSGFELEIELNNNPEAKKAISDNQTYDRWTTKYSGVLTAELMVRKYLNEQEAARTRKLLDQV